MEKKDNQNINLLFDNPISSLVWIISYGTVIFVGVWGNISLIATVCSKSSSRIRNSILIAACWADLLVTGISAPILLLLIVMNRLMSDLPSIACKTLGYIQALPVAASTISVFLLSLHRYVTVKHPRIVNKCHYLNLSLAFISWIISALINAPILFTFESDGLCNLNAVKGGFYTLRMEQNSYIMYFIFFHSFIVFIIPGLGVFINYYGVRQELCALSLTARAAHGEFPLPMPILRKPSLMIIVTGCVGERKFSHENLDSQKNRNIEPLNEIFPKSMQEIRNQLVQKMETACSSQYLTSIPLSQPSTLNCRKRLTHMLLASAIIFIACWLPHVFCVLRFSLEFDTYCSDASTYATFLLGFTYSAVSPLIYSALNQNAKKQSHIKLDAKQIKPFPCTKLRQVPACERPSSTNEAALGAFNPMLVRFKRKQYKAETSSHFLY